MAGDVLVMVVAAHQGSNIGTMTPPTAKATVMVVEAEMMVEVARAEMAAVVIVVAALDGVAATY